MVFVKFCSFWRLGLLDLAWKWDWVFCEQKICITRSLKFPFLCIFNFVDLSLDYVTSIILST